jgi:flagellar biosynthesis/type III secretory pathway chaperone
MQNEKLALFYFQVTDLWKRLCEEHTVLFDQTCEEYSHLLSSELELLDNTLEVKVKTIEKIKGLEKLRSKVVNNINKQLPPDTQAISSITELITYFQSFKVEREQKHLFRFNKLLLDIINKIQDQNKKNQIFINKALSSLKQIREDASGESSYPTYDQKGISKDKTGSAR